MATSGVGRGRGWLNLNKNNTNRPGQPPIESLSISDEQINYSSPPLANNGAYPQQYAKLISLINQLNNNDDGILMNQKFKIIQETWTHDCPTSNEVEDSFNYLYQKCLEDEIFAMKVVLMVASNTFSKVEISNQRIRNLFIGQIQKSYESSKQLQTSDPNAFRIAVRILSEFFNKARLATGKQIVLLVTPLLCYLEMLLDSAQPADLQLFTSQLYLNGTIIKSEFPQQLSDILNKVRQILICNVQLTQMSKIYLLLALDLANHRFGLLPPDILKLYQEELGDKVMASFQGSLGALSIHTQQSNKTLDNYQSNVNVLQVTPPDSTSPICESPSVLTKQPQPQQQQQQQQQKQQQHQQQHQQQSNSSQSYTNSTSSTFNNDSGIVFGGWMKKDKTGSIPNREKTGRPILGAGARLQKDKQESGINWRDHQKDNSSNWGKDKTTSGGKDKSTSGSSGWGDKKSKSFNKGWEHDDRFETDYQ